MDKDKLNPELNLDDIVLEAEGEPDEPQTDTIWVLDGRGRAVKMEVPDDD